MSQLENSAAPPLKLEAINSKRGPRWRIGGYTWPHRGIMRLYWGKWHQPTKTWYFDSETNALEAMREAQAAEILLAAQRQAQREQMANGLRPGDMIRGRVVYKNRPYFMLEFGPPCKLASTSGTMVFLAKREHVSQVKWYKRPLTWQQIQDHRQELKNSTLVTCQDGEDPSNI